MSRVLDSKTLPAIPVKTTARTWRLQLFTDLGQTPRLEVFREIVNLDEAGNQVGERLMDSRIVRELTPELLAQTPLVAQLMAAVDGQTDKWAEEEGEVAP
jgi:hypothetical protein